MYAMRLRGKQAGACAAVIAVSAFACVFGLATVGNAGPYSKSKAFPAIDETRLGVYVTNLEGVASIDGDYVVNGEVLFGRIRPDEADPIRQFLLNPRPHVGFSFNPSGPTSQVYGGLTWDVHLTNRLFVEGSFGGAVHDGLVEKGHPDSLGCSVLFHESAGIGIEVTERVRIIGTIEHSSNAGLCSDNQGITNAGVRLGLRW